MVYSGTGYTEIYTMTMAQSVYITRVYSATTSPSILFNLIFQPHLDYAPRINI